MKNSQKKNSVASSIILDTVRKALAHRYLPVVLATLAMTLAAPTLWRGWVDDDLIHRTTLLSSSLPVSLRELFTFLDSSRNFQLMDLGTIPWWTLEAASVSFFRPVTVLTLWLDYQLWPNSSELMHAHTILWYGGVCALATLFYRRFVGRGWTAGLASFLFAVDYAHTSPVASLAGRNVLLTLLFGLLTLLAHDRWRREGWRAGVLLGPLWLALAVLSAEAGVATAAYLLAYAVFLDRGTWRQRLGSLLPYAAIVGVWRLVYQYLGYGAWGSGFYVDPGREPVRFAAGVLERGPVLLLGQWGGIDPGLYSLLSVRATHVFWPVALLFGVVIVIALAPLLRKNRVARFWGLGMVLAVVPACAISVPSGRLLAFVGLGAMGLMAQLIGGLLDRSGWLPLHRAWRIAAWTLCLTLMGFHAILSPVLLTITPQLQDPFFCSVTELGPLPEAERQDVVIVNAPSPGHSIYVPSTRSVLGQPLPAHVRVLAPGCSSVYVTRIDAHTVIVRPEHGYLIPPGTAGAAGNQGSLPPVHLAYAYQHGDVFFRSGAFPMTAGQRIELTGMSVEVIKLTHDGRPSEARIRFARPLEDPSIVWLQWNWKKNVYVPFVVPAVGEMVQVPGPSSSIIADLGRWKEALWNGPGADSGAHLFRPGRWDGGGAVPGVKT